MRNRRTFLLLLAGVLLVVVLLQYVVKPPPPAVLTKIPVVVARQDIEPYSILDLDQVVLGPDEVTEDQKNAYFVRSGDAVGQMTTRFIKAGSVISRQDADLPENVRYVGDMSLEVVSFPAIFNEMVAGQVKPGHKVNIYGYRKRSGQSDPGALTVVASRVWVVDVRTSGGDVVQEGEGETTQQATGFLAAPSTTGQTGPGSVVTVAAEPSVVQDIIWAFGAEGYSAYVTLAPAEPYVLVATPTPLPEPTPTVAAPVTPPPATSEATPSAVQLDVYMTKSEGSERREQYFVNRSTTVWVAVELEYTPASGPTKINIDIRRGQEIVYEKSDLDHRGTGWQWYSLQLPGGFRADSEFTTTVYAKGPSRSVVWWTNVDGKAPITGG